MNDCHPLLEDNLVGEEAEAGAEGENLMLGLFALRGEFEHSGLPDLIVLVPEIAKLGQDVFPSCRFSTLEKASRRMRDCSSIY